MSVSIVLILIGLFVVVNSTNIVDVFQGNKTLNVFGGTPTTPGSSSVGSGGINDRGGSQGGTSTVTLESFKAAIASVESGGRYTARNANSGAYGKYQILPGNWPSWARAAGLSSNAPQTPANQETVATYKFTQYFNKYGSWQAVAHAWYTGSGAGSAATWSQQSIRYVTKVVSQLGLTVH